MNIVETHHKDIHRPCPKCGATDVSWVISFYYCETCYQRSLVEKTEEKPNEEQTLPKKRNTRTRKKLNNI